ncbi:hypothetical protein BKA62DRAFT_833783 [Auriculariales sp. MPI-PUGE-AT-0066]|nr:hypothetical protein BKA62DRAFT_833783 [Auriculariales sp. MPI-PUGE-AT-0066]
MNTDNLFVVVDRWFHILVVPRAEERTPLTWRNAPILLLPFMPLLAMAYLARRPNTLLLRALCFPLVLMSTTRIFFGYYFTSPGANEINWAMGMLAIYCLSRAAELCFVPKGRFKIGETAETLGRVGIPAIERENRKILQIPNGSNGSLANGSSCMKRSNGSSPRAANGFSRGLRDALELLCAVRGIGWDFGTGTSLKVPSPTRPLEKAAYMRVTIRVVFICFVALDALESFLKLWPGVGSPRASLPFYPTCMSDAWDKQPRAQVETPLSLWHTYALSTLLHTATGFAFVAGFEMCYGISSLVGVGLLGHQPASWPPFPPQTFLVMGGYPVSFVFALLKIPGGTRLGFVLGSFAASGAFHDFGMYAMGRGLDSRVFWFFFGQGILIIAEHAFRKITGRRVGGVWGRVWTISVIFLGGQPLVDSWHKRGLAGGMIIPAFVSPTRQLLWPLVRSAWGTFGCSR